MFYFSSFAVLSAFFLACWPGLVVAVFFFTEGVNELLFLAKARVVEHVLVKFLVQGLAKPNQSRSLPLHEGTELQQSW